MNVEENRAVIDKCAASGLAEHEGKLLFNFNNTKIDYENNKTINELIEEQVKKRPNNIALVFDNKKLSYIELNESANRLARRIIRLSNKKNPIVAIMVERSFEMVAGILGVLKAGAAFLPVDPKYPVERINYIFEDSKADILITQDVFCRKADFKGRIINLDNEELINEDTNNLANVNESDNLAYIIYTSGSTGKPKGVMVEHRSVVNFIKGVTSKIDFTEGKTILALTTISFDIFILETLLPLAKGLKIVIANENQQMSPKLLSEIITKYDIDMLQITPSRMKMLVEYDTGLGFLQNVSELMLGGEVFPSSLLRKLKSLRKARIYNMYGPTETTVWSTIGELTDKNSIDIGKPIANTKIHIVNENMELQPIGIEGELCISGDGLARGYLNLPELTDEKFVFTDIENGVRIYKTGDLAKWMPDGSLELLGRIDNQVKLRGYRIELAEIENCLIKYPGIKDCIVLTLTNSNGDQYLAAYYIGDSEIETSAVMNFLHKKLPEYMVPGLYIRVESFPLTPNGKVDRKALSKYENKHIEYKKDDIESENEKIIIEIWKRILCTENVTVNDNFFELGGNSVLLVMMHMELEDRFPNIMDVTDIFAYPTIAKLAQYIANQNLTSEQKDPEVSLLEFPPKYYLSSDETNDGINIQFNISNELLGIIEGICEKIHIEHYDVLLSIYFYLLSEIVSRDQISIIYISENGDYEVPINMDLSDISDINELFLLTHKKRSETQEIRNRNINKIRSYESHDKILPAFCIGDVKSIADVYDLVLSFHHEQNYFSATLDFNSSKLRKEKMKELVYAYIKLIRHLAKI